MAKKLAALLVLLSLLAFLWFCNPGGVMNPVKGLASVTLTLSDPFRENWSISTRFENRWYTLHPPGRFLAPGEYPRKLGHELHHIYVSLKLELHRTDCTWVTLLYDNLDLVELMRSCENRTLNIPAGTYDTVRVTVYRVVVVTPAITVERELNLTFECSISMTLGSGGRYCCRYDVYGLDSLEDLAPGRLGWRHCSAFGWCRRGDAEWREVRELA